MLRRSFRIGLLVGLLGGAIAAAVKAVQGRATSTPAPAPAWTPLPNAEPVVVPPRAPPAPSPAPTEKSVRGTVNIGLLQESPVAPAKKVAAKKAAAPKSKKLPPWVDPVDGECPPTHPIKAKMASGIFHVPGGFNYARTRPDRCYLDTAAAEADGLRPSKR